MILNHKIIGKYFSERHHGYRPVSNLYITGHITTYKVLHVIEASSSNDGSDHPDYQGAAY